MCRCAERRVAIVGAASALVRGDLAAAQAETGFVLRSATEDAFAAVRKTALAAAHTRLKR